MYYAETLLKYFFEYLKCTAKQMRRKKGDKQSPFFHPICFAVRFK